MQMLMLRWIRLVGSETFDISEASCIFENHATNATFIFAKYWECFV